MKNIALKSYVTFFCFFSNFMLFAQTGDNTGSGDLEADDAPVAPINGKLVFLAVAGIVFALYTFRKNQKEKAGII
ncbi:MAG: hypothetical protein RL708_620 [Bacteroidota bacterium]|jgi:hypothetical protein